MKHTKGPWEAAYDPENSAYAIYKAKPKYLLQPHAEVYKKADAHLIAAAPEMLELLKSLRDYMVNRGTEKVDVNREEILQHLPLNTFARLDLLITRAEGEK
jgi:hypothetical protein